MEAAEEAAWVKGAPPCDGDYYMMECLIEFYDGFYKNTNPPVTVARYLHDNIIESEHGICHTDKIARHRPIYLPKQGS